VVDLDLDRIRGAVGTRVAALAGDDGAVAVALVEDLATEACSVYRSLRTEMMLPISDRRDETDAVESDPATEGVRSWRLERTIQFITANLDRDLYIDDVAKSVGIGSQHLSRLFRDEIGSSFTRFVNERRVERARFLLATSSLNVSEIADRVGYRDANYFGKVFRRLVGVTPSEYRSRNGDHTA
jgi:AraC-like DNA-binding protein